MTADRPTILAADLGTSGCKAGLFRDGSLLAQAHVPLYSAHPRPGVAEQDANAWWSAFVQCVREVHRSAGYPLVDVIALTGQSDSLVAVGQDGQALRPAILWMDLRGEQELASALAIVSAVEMQRRTGLRPSHNYTAVKAAWLTAHEPDTIERTRWLLQPKDYLVFCLTQEAVTDPSSASRWLIYDRLSGRWDHELTRAFGLRENWLPVIAGSDDIAGPLSSEAATALGLPAGIPVTVGAADRAAEALGASLGAKSLLVSTGTSTAIMGVASRKTIEGCTLPIVSHAIAGESLVILSQPTSGILLRWLSSLLSDRDGRDPEAIAKLASEAAESPPGANGLLLLPHFMGARSVRWDPDARGVISGLTLGTNRADLARAVIEGVAFEVRACVARIAATQAMPTEVILAGGAHSVDIWCQTLVDVLGVTGVRLADMDSALVGAMLLGESAIGASGGARDAAAHRIVVARTYVPDREVGSLYDRLYSSYERLIEATGPSA